MSKGRFPPQHDQRYCETHGTVTSWSGYGKERADGTVRYYWRCDRCRYSSGQRPAQRPRLPAYLVQRAILAAVRAAPDASAASWAAMAGVHPSTIHDYFGPRRAVLAAARAGPRGTLRTPAERRAYEVMVYRMLAAG